MSRQHNRDGFNDRMEQILQILGTIF
jgi:hypothetical protein